MGVDYHANYGLGFQVNLEELRKLFPEAEEEGLDPIEYLELPEDCYWFSTGEGFYTGEEDDYFICIETDGVLVRLWEQLANKLIYNMRKLGLTVPDELSIVGGLLIS